MVLLAAAWLLVVQVVAPAVALLLLPETTSQCQHSLTMVDFHLLRDSHNINITLQMPIWIIMPTR
jgi:hypothetical protein